MAGASELGGVEAFGLGKIAGDESAVGIGWRGSRLDGAVNSAGGRSLGGERGGQGTAKQGKE